MKKLLYTIASLAALTAIACTKEQGTPEVRPEIPDTPEEVIEVPATLSGSMGDPTTKVSNDNNGAYKWQASDHVTILTNNGANREFTADEAGLTTEFSGHIPNTDALVGGFALYPASEDHSVSGTTITFNIPTTLTWGADASYMPMYAPIVEEAQKVKASFKAVGGTMKLICYNIPEGATTLAFTANVNIAGNFTVDRTTDPDNPTLIGAGTGKEIDIDFTGNYSANKVFYIPLPPVTLTGGFTISFFDSEATKLYEKTTTAQPAIGRNKLVIAPALNCDPAPADATLTNAELVAKHWSTGGYATDSITNSFGTWNFNAAYAGNYGGSGKYYMQLRNNATVSYLQLPSFSNDIASITLHSVCNGNEELYTGSIYFRDSADNNVPAIATAPEATSASQDLTMTIPEGYKTGYIMVSNACKIAAFTVKFRGTDITAPAITVGSNELTINVGSSTASTTASLANGVDGLGINWKFSGTNADKFEASLDGTTLTITAKETNSSASDYTATLTLKASGAVSKEIAITQKTKLVPNPAVTVTPGDSKFTATWTADENATSYVAYLHTATTATPETGGTTINPTNSGSAYSITDYAVTNGTTYYLYVKVNGVSSGYSAPSDYVEYSFKPVLWDLKSIAVTTAPKTTYTAGECFDPTGMVVTATYENHDNTEQTKQEVIDNGDLTFSPTTSTPLVTSDVSISITYGSKSTTQAITVTEQGVVDQLTNATTGISGTSYTAWSGKNKNTNNSGIVSDAVYAGQSAGGDNNSGTTIQLRSNNSNSGIVTTTSGGVVKKVTITWNSATAEARTLDVYGKNSAYSSASELYDANTQGTKVTSFTKSNGNGSYSFTTDYEYIGFRSNSGAMYIDEIDIEWESVTWDLSSIAVKTAPTKVEYEAGETFDPTGLVITATYSDHDGNKADKTEDIAYNNTTAEQFTFSPTISTALTTSDVEVTITWGGEEASQAITVNATKVWDLKSIAVKNEPNKTTYTEGEYFDPAGLVITPTYENRADTEETKIGADVAYSNDTAASFSFAPTTSMALETSNTSVSISYTEGEITQTTTYNITVNEATSGTPDPVTMSIFSNTATTTGSGATQTATWTSGDITVSAVRNAAGNTQFRSSDTDHTRFYSGWTITVSSASHTISSVEYTCTTNAYATTLGGYTFTNGTAATSGSVVTVSDISAASTSVTLSAQIRISSIKVTYE